MSYPDNPQWQQPYPQQQPPQVRHTNALAIIAFVMVFFFWPLAIVFGHIARGQIKRRNEDGKGWATAALVLGYLCLIVSIAVVAVLVFVATTVTNDQQNSTTTTVSTTVSTSSTDTPTETTEPTPTSTP